MKYTNNQLKSMELSENFIKMIENISETVISHGYISNSGGVIAEILFRRKITNLEKIGAVSC